MLEVSPLQSLGAILPLCRAPSGDTTPVKNLFFPPVITAILIVLIIPKAIVIGVAVFVIILCIEVIWIIFSPTASVFSLQVIYFEFQLPRSFLLRS